ncbi:MAG: Tripartite-type tricarboxylate transporter, receptor component TctC [Hyphomicrobiales bacterium]|nr:Tripartite-type tricarboxylate transporter, receptor component TctC [Hyphomicrobiales bacterium]
MRLGRWAALAALMIAMPAQADPVADFYRGNTIRIINWAAAGGEYDIHGKLVSRFLGRHIPGEPTVIHQTMTGGGGLVAANYLYNVAPKDGTSLGIMVSSLPLFQALGDQAVRFDAARFNWIGTIAPTQENLVAWHTTGFKTFDDLKQREFVLGASGAGSSSVITPTVANALLGTKIKIVPGYPGGSQINLAMERGESMGRWNTWSSWKLTNPGWIADKSIVFLFQSALSKPAALADVPLLTELAGNADDRKIFELLATAAELGRPLVGSPDIPAARAAALIAAYRALFEDVEFRREAEQLKIEFNPIIGPDLQKLVTSALATPKPLAERLKKLIE